MSLSLFAASALNASAGPVVFPPITQPDFWNCDNFYSHPDPPIISDCRTAFRNLPSGTASIQVDTKNLPISASHGNCEIHFHLSGQSFDKVDSVEILPDDIKSMAAWVIGHCGLTGKGGMVTKGLKKTIDAMNDGSSKVSPDPPLPTSSNFYSLFIWRPIHGFDEGFNAGNNDPGVGGAIEARLNAAIRETTRGSPAYQELKRRLEWLTPRVNAMEYEPMSSWWDGPPHQDPSVSTS